MLRKKLKFSANAGGREIVSGFFQMANDFMEKRDEKENLELEYLNSDSELDSDVDSEVDSEGDLMALPPAPESMPPTPELMPPSPELIPPAPELMPPSPVLIPPAPELIPPAPEQTPPTPERPGLSHPPPPSPEPMPPSPKRKRTRRAHRVVTGEQEVRRSERGRIPNKQYSNYV
jgi:hypothetical protein